MHPHKAQAKASQAKKLASFKSGPNGSKWTDKGTFSGGPEPMDVQTQAGQAPGAKANVQEVKPVKRGGAVKRLDRKARRAGGRILKAKGGKFEGSAKDTAEDKKLAKKRGMSLKAWEKSAADEEHDEGDAMKKGGRAKRQSGGRVGKKTKGTTVNIVIGSPGGQQATPPLPPPDMGAPPIPPPAPPAGPPMPPPGMMPPGAGGPPVMRKKGGRVGKQVGGGLNPAALATLAQSLRRKSGGRVNPDSEVKTPGRTSEGYPRMHYGALGGKGRREKILAQKD